MHFGLTFLNMADFDRLATHVVKLGIKLLVEPAVRFPNTLHEHRTLMLVDPATQRGGIQGLHEA